MTIFKYRLDIENLQIIEMPIGAQILHVDNQRGELCLWALVTPGMITKDRVIEIIGTGQPMDDYSRKHIGSAVVGPYVWHVFERMD